MRAGVFRSRTYFLSGFVLGRSRAVLRFISQATPLMQKKKIIVMGFMAGCPIAGVVWQHIHYIVGLQRLGYDVYYIEDSARLPYDPVAYEVNESYRYAAKLMDTLSREFGFEGKWAYCARYMKKPECVGMSLQKVRELFLLTLIFATPLLPITLRSMG